MLFRSHPTVASPTAPSHPTPTTSTPFVAAAPSATTATTAVPIIRLADLPSFSGTEPSPGLALDRWLQKLAAYFMQFPTFTDSDRLSTATMCLDGPALDWVRVNSPSPCLPNAWLAFVNTLQSTFAPLNRSLAARADLASCRQTGNVQDYLLHFNLASAPITDLFPVEKYQRFVEGLKPRIRQELLLNHPDILDFASAAAYASRFDILSTFTATTSTTGTPPPRPMPPPYRPPSARLNAVTTPAPTSTPYTPLTPELRDAINAKGGCVYCRNVTPPLHTIDNCPTRRPRPAWMLGNGRSQ